MRIIPSSFLEEALPLARYMEPPFKVSPDSLGPAWDQIHDRDIFYKMFMIHSFIGEKHYKKNKRLSVKSNAIKQHSKFFINYCNNKQNNDTIVTTYMYILSSQTTSSQPVHITILQIHSTSLFSTTELFPLQNTGIQHLYPSREFTEQ